MLKPLRPSSACPQTVPVRYGDQSPTQKNSRKNASPTNAATVFVTYDERSQVVDIYMIST